MAQNEYATYWQIATGAQNTRSSGKEGGATERSKSGFNVGWIWDVVEKLSQFRNVVSHRHCPAKSPSSTVSRLS